MNLACLPGGLRQNHFFRPDTALESAGDADRLRPHRAFDDGMATQCQCPACDIAVNCALKVYIACRNKVPGDLKLGRNNGVLARRFLGLWTRLWGQLPSRQAPLRLP